MHVLTALFGIALLGAGVFGWWFLTIGRWPLVGSRTMNFGEVALTGEVVALKHTFELRNRTNRLLVIQSIRPSCGCTALDTSGRIVEAGEVLQLPVTFNIAEVGPKSASMTLIFDDEQTQTLWVRAVGRRSLALQVIERSVDVGPEREGIISVLARVQDNDDPPPALDIEPAEGITAEAGVWELAAPREARRKIPALWRTSIRVTADGDLSRQGVTLIISLPGSDTWRVLVRGEPVRTEPPPMDFPDDL